MMNFSHYLIRSNQSVKEALIALNRLSADTLTLFVVDPEGKMTGTVTDGDIRRKLIDGICLNDPIYQAMNPDFYYLNEKEIDIEKVKIINNAVKLAGKLGIQCPKVAVITPVEVVNPKMQSTVDESEKKEIGTSSGCGNHGGR